mmetsp:Transcript_9614/g.14470  ORF Transcript_9614/g.14470 Transcript_9614/m.14470 type:complete len:762 (-) Transcript_9614:127-2412(-)|eukprot:CAMPEP_0185032056 /NCGR_PEP_ID=MMETSP1103-20130426/19890_1 /TAXON_ID=36769 /ORGANISM="Paraphysomonas bandaiensis, Strain Caron Lab Isolate" /LENGTH=761 /DNA_ID=CAMNT_0027567803 /DNA_START=15 /DNA_END=2300 /DNA_ORIENTATION=-
MSEEESGQSQSEVVVPDVDSKAESIKVLVRIRPLNETEIGNTGEESSVTFYDSSSLTLRNADNRKKFQCSFDAVLGPQSTQEEVYDAVQVCTSSVTDGFNSTIFAYGQTGSGKTHTMFGPPSSNTYDAVNLEGSLVGLIPRAIQQIFQLSHHPEVLQFSVLCSFVQLYNENCYDMLRDPNMAHPLTIREDHQEIYVQGLSEYIVKSVHETLQLLRVAEENRAIRETNMNQFSSRSHSIFQIFVEQRRVASDGGEVSLRAKFNLVDLAGSEKWNTKLYMRDEHISELTNINLSLHTLGKCISSLVKVANGKDTHVPYRESKLTRLLQDSLGGNSRTFLIATLSPSLGNAEESISTLKFADRAKQVMTQLSVNETRPVDHEMVMKLQREVKYLRQLLKKFTDKMATAQVDQSGGSVGTNEVQHSGADLEDGAISEAEMQKALMAATSTAKDNRIASLERENENLRVQLATSRDPVSPRIQRQSSKEKESHMSAIEALVTLSEQHDMLWGQTDILQNTLTRFFKFEIEEDVMRQLVEQVFATLARLRQKAMETKENVATVKQTKLAFDTESRNGTKGRKENSKNISNMVNPPKESKSSPSKASSAQADNFLPRIAVKRSDAVNISKSSLPSINSSQPPSGGVAYRVRGASSNSPNESAWIAPPTKEEEEEQIRASLAKAKKKINKNMKIQEWLKDKEARAAALQQQEEQERMAMEEAENEKERKRRARAMRQKKKLSGYYQRVKDEAEKIQEYKDLGIDPANLI